MISKRAKSEYDQRYVQKMRFKIMVLIQPPTQSPLCIICGYGSGTNEHHALQLDHKKGDGATDRKRFKSYKGFLKYYADHIEEAHEKLQVLCANCNWIKRQIKEEFN